MVALVAATVLFVGAVVGGVLTRPKSATKVERPTVNVVQMPRAPLTRAQQHRAKRSSAGRSPDSTPSPKSAAPTVTRRSPSAPVRRQTPRRHAPARPPARRRPAPTSAAQRPPGQTTPARPPADVQVPAPVTACVKPLGGVNCN